MRHGGDLITYRDLYGGEFIDFSSNINPLGVPNGLKDIIYNKIDELTFYPDIKYRKLKKKIAVYLGCKDENVVVGNGAVEIIDDTIMALGKKVITTTPAFSEYSLRGQVHNKRVIEVKYNKDFTVNTNALIKHLEEGDLIILGNPNNPTGLRVEPNKLDMLYKEVVKKDAYLLLDEAFFEFAPKDYDSINLFKKSKYKNIIILRAATKFFGMPGIRLGYACTSKDIAEKINKIKLPWSINTIAEIAGNYIFDNKDYIEKSIDLIFEERKFMMDELKKISWIKAYNTDTNYILIQLLKSNEKEIFNFFARNGILVRKCSSFKELGNRYIRVAIKDRKNNKKLIEVFNKFEKEIL